MYKLLQAFKAAPTQANARALVRHVELFPMVACLLIGDDLTAYRSACYALQRC